MARSTGVPYAFEWVRLLKCHLNECKKLVNGQDIDCSEEIKMATGLHLPFYWGYIPYYMYSNMFTGIYSRFQVIFYRTIGPLVIFVCKRVVGFFQIIVR